MSEFAMGCPLCITLILYQVTALSPRELLDHSKTTTLTLLNDEPDLPVGSTVKVWCSRWFHCETLEYIQYKQAESEKRTVEKRAHEAKIKNEAQLCYLDPVKRLLEGLSSKQIVKSHLEDLYKQRDKHHRIYKAHWRAQYEERKRLSDDAYASVSVINTSIDLISEYVFDQMRKQGIDGKVAYAYSPKEGASDGFFSPGKSHFQLHSQLTKGRLKRDARDALCKPANKFWGLEGFDDRHTVTCQNCLYKMINLLND
ncbi:hypothetical protein [Teredinibacter purpureus]|uniref:hypothetical protein n=1 Tax=Teredinibacter purpureus TaxID=2731756 RepID=UPI0005F88976|nr:hypothetical protein [Teredinibacter purpureus]